MRDIFIYALYSLRGKPVIGLGSAALFAAVLFFNNAAVFAAAENPSKTVVVGYVFPQNHVLQPGEIAARKLTRINYAFANIQNGVMVEGFPTDAANFAVLNALKKQNPSLRVLVSVGGWSWSGNFSDAALTSQSRRTFIDSAVAFIERYKLDGVDIDWEYPGQAGAGNRFRPKDKQNYTALLKELRQRFSQEEGKLHRRLYLTIATGANMDFLRNAEMGEVQKYVDTVNLMAYDYYVPGSAPITGNSAPLFIDPRDPNHVSADESVREYEQAGVPAAKIVLGVPFLGYEWSHVSDPNHGLFQPGKPASNAFAGYADIQTTLLKPGSDYTRYWDSDSAVPYLYNSAAHVFVSYDDTQSVRIKCRYVLDHHLGGVMFWNYSGDPTGALLDAIDGALLRQSGALPVANAHTGARPR